MTHITLCIRHHTWFLIGASLLYTRRCRPSSTSILNVMVLHRYVFYPVHHLYMQYGISCDWFYQHCFKSILYNIIRIDCLGYRLKKGFEHQTSNYFPYKIRYSFQTISDKYTSHENFSQPIVVSWPWYFISSIIVHFVLIAPSKTRLQFFSVTLMMNHTQIITCLFLLAILQLSFLLKISM